MSKIEWTEETWNPIVGCSIVSPGCTNCYAMKMAGRIEKMNRTGGSGSNYVNHYDGTTRRVNGNTVWTGKLALAPENTLLAPLGRKKPTTYFVNSMGDLFHEDCPDEWIDRVFAVMALCPQHTFQALTKRAERMRQYFDDDDREMQIGIALGNMLDGDWIFNAGKPWRKKIERLISISINAFDDDDPTDAQREILPLPNVWLGVSAERQEEVDERVPLLLQTPAAVRFISAEPLLGPIDLTDRLQFWHEIACDSAPRRKLVPGARLDWVIVGGESGANARPMSIQWARELRDQCAAAEVAFFFKQWGEWAPAYPQPSGAPGRFAFGDYEHDRSQMIQCDGYPRQFTKLGARSTLQRVGKKAASRLLDGQEHNAYPPVRP